MEETNTLFALAAGAIGGWILVSFVVERSREAKMTAERRARYAADDDRVLVERIEQFIPRGDAQQDVRSFYDLLDQRRYGEMIGSWSRYRKLVRVSNAPIAASSDGDVTNVMEARAAVRAVIETLFDRHVRVH